MSDAIEIKNLTKTFGERNVLDGVSTVFAPGKIAALIGPSGGGKSTLLRCLNGLQTFDEGRIRVGDQELAPGANHAAIRAIRRRLGMIFQDFQLFPHFTAIENVIEAPLRVLGKSRKETVDEAEQLLSRVGLAERKNHYPRQLSGGQKQRVAIARALAMKPQGLLCDEITSALDPELKYEVLETLSSLRDEGMTIVMVTHEIGFARRAADQVAILADGKIIEEGAPAEVLEKPKTTRAQRFLSQVLA
jgi:ABC-type polar amino acid transport system ATPase subunit